MAIDSELMICDWVEKVKKLKYEVLSGSSDDIKWMNDYFSFVPRAGGYNNEIYDTDLSNYTEKHKFLMVEVNKIHQLEIDEYNSRLTKQNSSFDDILREGVNGRSGNQIYILNNSDMEYIFVGDIHSDIDGFDRMLRKIDFFKSYKSGKSVCLVFTGDYVDRGKAHLDILGRIMMLKYIFTDRVILLRGNHDGGVRNDDGTIKLPYRVMPDEDITLYFPLYSDDLAKKNPTYGCEMTELYFDFFNKLSYVAIIRSNCINVMAVHGGVPRPTLNYGNPEDIEKTKEEIQNSDVHKETTGPDDDEIFGYINSLADLTDENIKDFLGRSIIQNIMWSDPMYPEADDRKSFGRFKYYENHFDAFKEKFGVDHIIRGHEAKPEGIVKAFDGKVYTVFSSGVLESVDNATTAYSFVKAKVLSLKKGEFKEIEL